ncbi:hypothetical protein N7448_000071 [Penicillium atrosanguineum]|uniref:Uncharacterized protein n=1 Tax=Penicillium atrosanguineum TaxID=1132637 RepID=A0A9W9HHN2_9EURO|nr:Dephospho-CoA kinase [Penicillium atrosanguineum]KAJ5134909.1 hypothetical protein N7526_006274 [Penicillium atrosanguineum]KAJ5148493.1 hypothetical protein N7448_000071 [Penicillium atrosanguineum]KAJ5303813.1 Dephospho-CoA kinase [Penicillium atrosanguineum]KAJ5323287.1 hypothetical protein N7476_001887 [Penicillium atrosanguineum]
MAVDQMPVPRRFLLISVPRTASNLLLKVLNIPNQPGLVTNEIGGYFFYSAFFQASQEGHLFKAPEDWSDEDVKSVKGNFQTCTDTLEKWSAEARDENKVLFAKEHAFWTVNPASFQETVTGHDASEFSAHFRVNTDAYGPNQSYSPSNKTIFSDEYLRSWQMAFIIRHPALAWPSMYRAMSKVAAEGFMDEDGIKGASGTNMSLRWSRMLYDWCMEQPDVPTPPPVIDAHDLIHNPEVVLKLCEQTGLDKNVVQFEWDQNDAKKSDKWAQTGDPNVKTDEHALHNRAASIMLSSLEASKGVIRDKAPANIDIAAEAAKWRIEFGEEAAQFIEKAVWDSMPDYEYLKSKRITPEVHCDGEA